MNTQAIDVIIPVYKGLETLKNCLDSIFGSDQDQPYEILLINDASPEKGLAGYLDEIASKNNRVRVIRNNENQGFVKSVNTGMVQNPDRDVILLNSDTIVAGNWIDRLHRCAYKSDKIGSVTPFSNNATICSFPRFCQENDLPHGLSVQSLDDLFKSENQGQSVPIPTGVGFCMFIKRSCLNEVGLFNEVLFGRGYGEENDFCMRASQMGWEHHLCADLFVYHEGNVSFSSEKEDLLNSAMATLHRLHPEYHHRVHAHIAQNPAHFFRVNVLIKLIKISEKQKVLFIGHNRGGGTEKCMQELVDININKMMPLTIRPHGNGEIVFNLGISRSDAGFRFKLPSEYSEILKLCHYLDVSRVHYHHTMGIEPQLLNLAKDLAKPADITLHDYYFINSNPTLTDIKGRFCSSPGNRDQVCGRAYPIPGGDSPQIWRERQLSFLRSADRIFSPSQFTADIYKSYFEGIDPIVAYHADWEADAPYCKVRLQPVLPANKMKILAIGALGREKGADLLEACAKYSKKKNKALEFILVGYAHRTLNSAVKQSGPYFDGDLDTLITRHDPHIVWFPALWPETYSYTLSAALRLGLPVVAPDIGSFPERLKDRPLSWIRPWDIDKIELCNFFVALKREVFEKEAVAVEYDWESQPKVEDQRFLYHHDYITVSSSKRKADDMTVDRRWIIQHLHSEAMDPSGRSALSKKEKLLMVLLGLRNNKITRTLSYCIPYRFQQSVKRRLSKRPIHEYFLRSNE